MNFQQSSLTDPSKPVNPASDDLDDGLEDFYDDFDDDFDEDFEQETAGEYEYHIGAPTEWELEFFGPGKNGGSHKGKG